jgi:hypothetical protein
MTNDPVRLFSRQYKLAALQRIAGSDSILALQLKWRHTATRENRL